MKAFLMAFLAIFAVSPLLATDPDPQLIIPVGYSAVIQQMARSADRININLKQGKRLVGGTSVLYNAERDGDLEQFTLARLREVFKDEQNGLVVGEKYRFAYNFGSPQHGTLGDGSHEFTHTGNSPEIQRAYDTWYFVPIQSKATKVRVHIRGRTYETANGVPPECDLINIAGNGYIYLSASTLSRGPAEITVFYGTVSKTIAIGPRLIPVKPSVGEIKPLHNRPGFTFNIESLESQKLAIEASTDSRTWNTLGETQANQFGEAEFTDTRPNSLGLYRVRVIE